MAIKHKHTSFPELNLLQYLERLWQECSGENHNSTLEASFHMITYKLGRLNQCVSSMGDQNFCPIFFLFNKFQQLQPGTLICSYDFMILFQFQPPTQFIPVFVSNVLAVLLTHGDDPSLQIEFWFQPCQDRQDRGLANFKTVAASRLGITLVNGP